MSMLSFLERRGLIEMFSQLKPQWRKNLAQNCQTSHLSLEKNNFVRFVELLFFHV